MTYLSIGAYFAYALVAISYIASPGPAVFLTISNSITYGFNKSLLTIVGNSLGLAFLAFLFSIGISELLVKYPTLINIIKIVGALYIGYIALKSMGIIRGSIKKDINDQKEEINYNGLSLIREGFFLAATNPKPILFFGAVFPHFIIDTGNFRAQFILLSCIFIILSASTLITYSIIAKISRNKLKDEKFKNRVNFCFGILLLLISIMLGYSAIFS